LDCYSISWVLKVKVLRVGLYLQYTHSTHTVQLRYTKHSPIWLSVLSVDRKIRKVTNSRPINKGTKKKSLRKRRRPQWSRTTELNSILWSLSSHCHYSYILSINDVILYINTGFHSIIAQTIT
jgi:hypothetical protein